MGKIIGITGRKRSGKDTVARYVGLYHMGTLQLAFATPIKEAVQAWFGFSDSQVHGNEKETPDPRWGGLTPRRAMQTLGTEIGRMLHPEVWIRYALREATEALTLSTQQWDVITDVRFPNEVQAIQDAGGYIVGISRPGLTGEDTHASEDVDALVEAADYQIINDGSLNDLRAQVAAFVDALTDTKEEK